MKKLLIPVSLALLTMTLAFPSCEDINDSLPKEYVGFEIRTQDLSYRPDENRREISAKIIAVEKSKKDRTVTIDLPQNSSFYEVKDTKITIKSGEKSAYVTIIFYPKKIGVAQYIQLICRPQAAKSDVTKLTIRLVKQ